MVLIKFSLFPLRNADMSLGIGHYFILVLSVMLIGTAGYLIQDIHSVEPDKINFPDKPLVQGKISIRQATTLYIVLTSIGILLGMYISYYIGYTSYGMLFIASAAIPYLYATSFKNAGALGNFILASLGFVAVCIPGIFDLMPAITPDNQLQQARIFKVLLLYGGFGFALVYIESMLANLRTYAGDRRVGIRNMTYQLGVNGTKKMILASSIITFLVLLFCIYTYIDNYKLLSYLIFAVLLPFIYFIIQVAYLNKEKWLHQIKILQNILKIVYITGMLSLIFLDYFQIDSYVA